jgi:hypothetical protein
MSKPAVPGSGPEVARHPVGYVTRKLPHVTVVFWILKIAATTLGRPVVICSRRRCKSDT